MKSFIFVFENKETKKVSERKPVPAKNLKEAQELARILCPRSNIVKSVIQLSKEKTKSL